MDNNQEDRCTASTVGMGIGFAVLFAIVIVSMIICGFLIKRLTKPSFFLLMPKSGLRPKKLKI